MYTYERDDNKTELETYEWDNVWWEHAEDKKGKRVLYIGDSISCGVRYCINNSNSGIYCDGFGSSKALDNRYFMMQFIYLRFNRATARRCFSIMVCTAGICLMMNTVIIMRK